MRQSCEERFFEIYGRGPEGVTFSPYRICPIGAHSDHNLGKVTGLAIDKGSVSPSARSRTASLR